MHEKLREVMNRLMEGYRARVPEVDLVTKEMIKAGLIEKVSDVENDHIAFRTFRSPHLGVPLFEKILVAYGYEPRDTYRFEGKKLNARWYAPPSPEFPRVFVSELCVEELSTKSSSILRSYLDGVPSSLLNDEDLGSPQKVAAFLQSRPWEAPSFEEYQTLLEETEYGAWTLVHGLEMNHYTLSVHNLPAPFHTLERFNQFLEEQGFTLNNSGGKLKISPDGGLLQSSTVAGMEQHVLSDGKTYTIAGSYVEFAERKVLERFHGLSPSEIRNEHRREGFEALNADRIFESTYLEQVGRH